MRCFLLSVVCNRLTGRNKDVFCMFGVAQGKSGQGFCILMSTWKMSTCSVDWTNSLLPLHHACHTGWLFMYWQDHQWGLVRLNTVPAPAMGTMNLKAEWAPQDEWYCFPRNILT